ncbi:ABC transporter substrate-binding protein [Agrobacterium rubi]|uniref:ABC transporter substrate-binding protein n=1 Tax=Agrobacterium rubi TaxID=28099 RepID=UPI001574324E|nr:ABC transporter substrate-binding protein [Agrobacterium rubi]NTF08411.1 ABC transporter substrate-binding protein [Agrobacterium rubi]NTF20639.1 ABC transporter substrate-binding protein [Agrobacterium rubi]NTF27609.1 ABC transporter substrate-binding protein [Agrobacterium rubi]
MPPLTRRTLLAATAAAFAVAGRVSAQPLGPRVATLDWALLETLLAIGANVVAATELRQFAQVAVKPDVPPETMDIGLRGTPNFEALYAARPDIIFNSNFYAWADPLISRIAPVESHAIYTSGESPYALAQKATLGIGEQLKIPAARNLVDELAARLGRYKSTLADHRRPVLLINLGDARHFRVFGADSMFGEVLTRIGLTNAWKSATSYSATAPVGIETLAAMPNATIILIPPHPQDALEALIASAFWNALPAVQENRVVTIGSINPYGALPAASRFADMLAQGLSHVQNG